MASGILTDFNFNSNVFADTMKGRFTTKLGLKNALAQEIPDSVIGNKTGYYLNLPQFKSLGADSIQVTSSSTSTVNALGDFNTIFPWCERELTYGTDQILLSVAGKDPQKAVAEMLADKLAIEVQRFLISALKGAFATALASTHSYNGDSGSTINVTGLNQARLLLGDSLEELTEIVMHSKVYTDAVNDKLVTQQYVDNEKTFVSGAIDRILGMGVSKVDALTAVSSVYNSYLGAKGSLMFSLRPMKPSSVTDAKVYQIGDMAQVEVYRVPGTAGGQDLISLRFGLACGVYGTAWNVSGGGSNPTEATIETGSNWTKVANDDKLIPLIQYKSL